MKRTRVLSLLIFPIAFSMGCAPTTMVTGAQQVKCPTVENMKLHAETRNGSISVQPTDDELFSVVATVRALNEERLAGVTIVTEEDNGLLNVLVDWPDGRMNSEGADLAIEVPNSAEVQSLQLTTSNGKIKSDNMYGSAMLKTSNGGVDVENHIGDVQIDTSNGRIDATEIVGGLTIDNSNGSVTANEISGAVRVKTSNGKARIVLTEENANPFDVKTSNGKVEVTVGAGFSGRVTANTSNGKTSGHVTSGIEVDSPEDDLALQFGESEELSTIRTSNGSVHIKERTSPSE